MALLVAVVAVASSGCVFVTRSSVSSSEAQADGASQIPSSSGDGRYVAFQSDASNLVPGDTNGVVDLFVRDHQTGDTERVSVVSGGAQATGSSNGASITDDGRYVAFASSASNLVAADSNDAFDVFVHDRTADTTERVSVATGGTQANHGSAGSSISDDGRYVAFHSLASNLVAGDTNATSDVFVHDRSTATTERVSVATGGAQANGLSTSNAINSDGRYVAFSSAATNLVAGDTNGFDDVFVRDRTTGNTQRVSVGISGQANLGASDAEMNAGGRFVAFSSGSSNLVLGDTNGTTDVFLYDRTTGITERVSVASGGPQANGGSVSPSMSGNGRYVAFSSDATNLVTTDTNNAIDVFVRDRTNGWTQRASLDAVFGQANMDSFQPSISGDGRFVGFHSDATNLVGGDSNGARDVFLRFALPPGPLGTTGSTSIARGTTGTITLTGSWFDPSLLRAFFNPSAGIALEQIAVQSPNTTVVLTITVASGAATGPRDILPFNPGNPWNVNAGGGDQCSGCLVVS